MPHNEIMRTKIVCPACKMAMTIRNLKYRHKCRAERVPADVELLVNKAYQAAVNAHQARMSGSSVEDSGES